MIEESFFIMLENRNPLRYLLDSVKFCFHILAKKKH